MNIFSYIKSRVTIWDVVNEYATLKKAGTYWKGRCPFHHEKTASFTVSPHKEIFYCFGCHAGGDVISFVSKVENCSQLEAAQFLADRYHIELPKNIEITETNTEEKKQYFDICKAMAMWCNQQLKKNTTIQGYLRKRGINQEQIEYFTLGFFPGGLQSIKKCLQAVSTQNILAQDLIDAHIISQGKTVLYSPFEERIIFPIKDHLGRFCGFGGRVYKPEDKRPKYYNSRENEYFIKGSILFGLDVAKKAIQDSNTALMVEGYTDCIAMAQDGFKNTVATLGTACTLAHLKLLSRYASYLYILYDRDVAGEKAILRLTQLCWQANMELKVVLLPMGQDPASFLAAGNKLQKRIDAAQDIFEFFIDSVGKGFSLKPLHEKATIARSLIETIQGIQDPLKVDILLQKASNLLDIPFETLKKEAERTKSAQTHDSPKQIMETTPQTKNTQETRLEKKIFCAIIHNVDLFNSPNDHYLISYMPTPLGDILEKLKEAQDSMGSFEFTQFFDTLNENEKRYVSKLLLEHEESITQENFEQLLVQFHKKRWKQIVRSIQTKLTQAKQEGNQEKVQKILSDFITLKQKILQTITHHQ